jgi:hypothetical protein
VSDLRRAIIKLSQQEVERLVRLPDGLQVVGVTDDWPRHGIRILIEGDVLDPVDERTEPPTLFGTWHYDRATGRTRWEAPFTAAQDPS